MRVLTPIAGVLFLLATLPAMAQGTDPLTGARPGHIAGIGDSLPRSDNAGNISGADSRSPLAATLPDPGVDAAASTREYLTAAHGALVAGHSGQAQQALEMAETRLLGWAMFNAADARPPSGTLITQIRDARQAIGSHDNVEALRLIDLALAG